MIRHNTTYRSLYAWMWVIGLGALGVFAAIGTTNVAERTETITQTTEIPYSTTYVEDDTVEYGKTVVRTKGHSGKRTLTYEVKRKGSSEISRKLVSDKVTTEPTTEVVARGTKSVWHCKDTTSFDRNPYNDNYCWDSYGNGKYVPDSEAAAIDPTYRPGKSGAAYYNNF